MHGRRLGRGLGGSNDMRVVIMDELGNYCIATVRQHRRTYTSGSSEDNLGNFIRILRFFSTSREK